MTMSERDKMMLIHHHIEQALQIAHLLKRDTGHFWHQYVDVPSCMEALIDIHESLEEDLKLMDKP